MGSGRGSHPAGERPDTARRHAHNVRTGCDSDPSGRIGPPMCAEGVRDDRKGVARNGTRCRVPTGNEHHQHHPLRCPSTCRSPPRIPGSGPSESD
jgi:hypothetical protein